VQSPSAVLRKSGLNSPDSVGNDRDIAPGQRARFGDSGINAHLAVRGRGQAPQPRSGASKAPGLRSATHRETIKAAARRPQNLTLPDRSSADLYSSSNRFQFHGNRVSNSWALVRPETTRSSTLAPIASAVRHLSPWQRIPSGPHPRQRQHRQTHPMGQEMSWRDRRQCPQSVASVLLTTIVRWLVVLPGATFNPAPGCNHTSARWLCSLQTDTYTSLRVAGAKPRVNRIFGVPPTRSGTIRSGHVPARRSREYSSR
jgi:hypothetical protein